MPIDRKATLQLLEELIAIESVNSTLVSGASGEQRAAEHVKEFLCSHGVPAELEEAAPRRPNVVAVVSNPAGTATSKPALMIVAHIDTVGAGDMLNPFTPRIRDGKMYGRGALDIKSGVAAMCAAAVAIAEEHTRLARSFVIAAVVDEECNSIGTEALLQRLHGGLRSCSGAHGFATRRRSQGLCVVRDRNARTSGAW